MGQFSVLAVAALLSCAAVQAAPVVSFSSSSYQVGDTVTVIVSDNNPADGADPVNGFDYAADFQLSYDIATLAYLGSSASQASFDIYTAPDLLAGDPDPAGNFVAQVVQLVGQPSTGALFSISFQALQASASSPVQLAIPTGGVYGALTQGAGAPVVPVTSAQVTVTTGGGSGGGTVPEPSSAGLLLAAGLAGALALRRRPAPVHH